MTLQIVQEPVSADVFNSLCRSVGWAEVAPRHYDLAVSKSIACVQALQDDTIVGCGRLVGDIGMYVYVQDLIVHSDFQGQGIGNAMLSELESIDRELEDSRHRLLLIAEQAVQGFYQRTGYAETRPASRVMAKFAQE